MAISLNNHETRIKALENGGSNDLVKTSNTYGYCVKSKSTGIKIQWGNSDPYNVAGSNSRKAYFAEPFSDTNYYFQTCHISGGSSSPQYHSHSTQSRTTTYCQFGYGCRETVAIKWIAIGY